MPGGIPQKREHTYEFSVQIDKNEPIVIPKSGPPQLVSDIALGGPHLVILRDGGDVIESFRFTFESRGGSHLCLSYTPWYQTWQLDPPRPGASWCRCESKK
jgi:hypothetical protein